MLQRYLDIEAIRFGDRLTVIVDVPAEIRNIQVPSFLLQPLVENAVRHGVAPRVEPGRVMVRAQRDGDVLCIDVEDDGAGFRVSPPHAAGIGPTAPPARTADGALLVQVARHYLAPMSEDEQGLEDGEDPGRRRG